MIGRKTVNFGNFATYAPFTHSHSSHYFWAKACDPLIEPTPHVKLGAEYLFNDGFVPLILPKVVSDRSVQSHTLIVGATLTF